MAKRQARNAQDAATIQDAANAVADARKDTKMENTNEQIARDIIPATTVYNLSQDAIDAAINDGHIAVSPDAVDVTIKADSSPTKRDEKQPYQQLVAITFEGMVLLSGGKAEPAAPRGDAKVDARTETEKSKGAPDHFNYGLDLEVKRNLRRQLETEISGPAKIIERTAKLLFDQKMFPSLDAAREHVKAMRASAGLDV
jgi:hypothetical protein